MEEWTKLRENYDDIDVHLSIYEEIRKEMDEEADHIFEEYEKSVNFPNTSHQDGGDVANYSTNPSQRLIRCAACGRKHDYNIASQFPNDNGHLVSFCVCGHLTVDRRTKVLEPSVTEEDICKRILSTAAGHATVCSSAPFIHAVDNANDGTQLIMFCQACGMQLVIWWYIGWQLYWFSFLLKCWFFAFFRNFAFSYVISLYFHVDEHVMGDKRNLWSSNHDSILDKKFI